MAGNPYGADTSALPGYSFSVVYVTTCTFAIDSLGGTYMVVGNTMEPGDWGDLNAGDFVEVAAAPGGVEILGDPFAVGRERGADRVRGRHTA